MKSHSVDAWKSPELAKTYLEGVRGAIPLASEQIAVMLRLIEARREPVRSFLDLGCGNGILAAAVLGKHSNALGTLVDFSEPMIGAAREHLSSYALQLRFVESDFGEPAWVDAVREGAPFDAVVSGFAVHHQTDERKRALYREIYDLLAPNGVFINVEHVSSPSDWVREAFDNLTIDALFAEHERRGSGKTRETIAKEYYYRPDKVANILAPVEAQCDWLREIGYQDVDCYLKLFEFAVFGGRRPRIGRR